MKIQTLHQEEQWLLFTEQVADSINEADHPYCQFGLMRHAKDYDFVGKTCPRKDVTVIEQRMKARALGMYISMVDDYNDWCDMNGDPTDAEDFQRYFGRTHDHASGRLEVRLERLFRLEPCYVLSKTNLEELFTWCRRQQFDLSDMYLFAFFWGDNYEEKYMTSVVNFEEAMKRYLTGSK